MSNTEEKRRNMKGLYNKYKKEIWIGVVVSLITAAIIKIGDWFVKVIPTIGTSIFETISNILYSSAATYSDNIILRIILLSGFSALVGLSTKTITDGLKIYKAALRLEKNSKKFSEDKLNEINEQATAELESEKKSNKTETIPELVEKGKKAGKSVVQFILITAFTYLFIIFFITAPMSLSNEFEHDIVKIAPYVEENDVKQLKSDWVCMRSKADYDELYKYIDKIKAENNLP